MKKLFPFFALLLICLPMSAQNLLTNGGFETWSAGKPNVWSISNASYLTQSTSIFNEGVSAAKMNTYQLNKGVTLTQSKLVTPGKTYTVSVSYLVEYGDGTDAKIAMYFRNSANKAISMTLEDSLALKGPGGNSAYFKTELGTWKTYTCDVVAPPTAANFYFRVQNAAYSIVYWDNLSLTENSSPTTYLTKTNLVNFNYTPGNGPSAAQTFTVKGNNLTSNLVVNAPTNYEISTLSTSGYTSSISIAPSSGMVPLTTLYIRLKSGLASGNYNENVTVSSTGVTNQTISLIGSVGTPPVVINSSVTGLSVFSYNQGNGPSPILSFVVSGSGLTGSLSIAASANYEISFTGGTGFSGISSSSIAQSAGNIANTTIYVRLKSGLSAANYNGTVTLTSSGSSKTISLTGVVTATPVLTFSAASLSGFRYELGAGPSPAQQVNIGGSLLAGAINVTASTNYEVSLESSQNFNTSVILPASSGTVTPTPIFVRLKAGLIEAGYNGTLSITSTSAVTQTVALTSVVASNPQLTISSATLSGFTYRQNSGPSAEQVVNVSGTGLAAAVSVTAPADYVISFDSGINFTSNDQLMIPITNGALVATPIYVRLDVDLVAGNYNEQLTVTSGSVPSKAVALNGTVTGLPLLSLSKTSISNLDYPTGNGPSSAQSFTLSGDWLTSNATIATPNNFELSLDQNNWTNSPSSLTLTPTLGTLSATPIYVRLKSGLSSGNYSDTLYISTNEANASKIAVSGTVNIYTAAQLNSTGETSVIAINGGIKITQIITGTTIEIYNTSGQLLMKRVTDERELIVPIQNKGMVVVRVGSKSFPLVIK